MGAPLIPGLGEELTVAAGRLHRRRRRRIQLATAGALVVVFAGAMAVTATIDAPPAEAGLEITERDGRIDVRLVDVETRPQVVEDALRDADIDADVVDVPVSPSLVGRFVTYTTSEPNSGVRLVDTDSVTFTGFSVPSGYSAHLQLSLGRPARPGEHYAASGSAVSVGEPLACLDLLGHPARGLAAIADDHPDIQIDFRPLGVDVDATPIDEVASGPYADWTITDIRTVAPDVVLALLSDGGESAGSPPSPPTGC